MRTGILARITAALVSLGCTLAAAQSLTPEQRGDCPSPPPGVQVPTFPPTLSAPAHYFAPVSQYAKGTFPFRLSVWRAPCPGHAGALKAWVKLTRVAEGPFSSLMPTITVFQNGKRLGTIPSKSTGPNSSMVISDPDDPPTSTTWTPSNAFSLLGSESVAFDPRAAFSLLVLPQNGPWGPDAVRVEVPDAASPGNLGLLPQNVGGLWWNPDRPGWGLIIDRNEREVVFATWLTYNDEGRSIWFVMPHGTAGQDRAVTGAAYSPRGKPFSTAAPWAAPGTDMGAPVGSFSIHLDDNTSGTFTYQVNGIVGTEPIKRLVLPRLAANAYCESVGGLWYDATRDGWGVALENPAASPYCPEHFSLLTYDEAGRTAWYFGGLMPTGESTFGAPNWFSGVRPRYAVKDGALYRPMGPSYRQRHVGNSLNVGSPVGWAEVRWATDGQVRSTVSVGSQQQVIDMRKFSFEY